MGFVPKNVSELKLNNFAEIHSEKRMYIEKIFRPLKTPQQIKKLALKTLDIESEAIRNLKSFIDESFVKSVQLIQKSKGRVVVTGIGKSAIIGQKSSLPSILQVLRQFLCMLRMQYMEIWELFRRTM